MTNGQDLVIKLVYQRDLLCTCSTVSANTHENISSVGEIPFMDIKNQGFEIQQQPIFLVRLCLFCNSCPTLQTGTFSYADSI